MTPLQVSAQFAAYLWYKNQPEHADHTPEQARQFAADFWETFLPNGHEGLGRLLKKIAGPPPQVKRRKKVRAARPQELVCQVA